MTDHRNPPRTENASSYPPDPELDEQLSRYTVAQRRDRRTDLGVAPPPKTPSEVEQAFEIGRLRVELESLERRDKRTIPPSFGSARWWGRALAKGLAWVVVAGGSFMAYWSRIDPPKTEPSTTEVAVQAKAKSTCEEWQSKAERRLVRIENQARLNEDWIASVLEEDDFVVSRSASARSMRKINTTRPITRALRPAIVINSPQPVTPGEIVQEVP